MAGMLGLSIQARAVESILPENKSAGHCFQIVRKWPTRNR
jgi:hypothetical protein